MPGVKPLWARSLALGALLSGCNGGIQTDVVADEEPFKVALLTPGSISDSGWNSMAYEGLMAIETALGAKVNNMEATDAQIRDSMRSYAQNGYDLVLGHGYEYNAPGLEVAEDFPDTVFVSSSGNLFSENSGTFRFHLEQGFYLAGYLAASMSQTGKIAAIGLNAIPSIKSTFRGFAHGARAANPDIVIIEPEMGSTSDIAAMKQATLAAINEGADFVIHQANEAAQGVFDACKEKGVYALGANLDQNDNPSGVVIASAVIVAKPAYVALAKEVRDGTYEGKVMLMGMSDGAIGFVVNPALADRIPARLLQTLDDLGQHIALGNLVIPMDEF